MNIPNPNIFGSDEADQSRPTFITGTCSGLIPAHHHILPLIKPQNELQPLAIDLTAAGDSDILRILRQYHIPSVLLHRIILQPSPSQHRRVFLYLQHHSGLQEHSRRQVIPRREDNSTTSSRPTGVDCGLNRFGVVVDPIAGGAIFGDGDSNRGRSRVRVRKTD